MARERHLSKAPIREAVLDLRFPLSDTASVPALRDSLEALDDFGEMHELRPGSATIHFPAEGEPEGHIEQGDVFGFRATTNDGLWVAQYRLDGLTLSRLQPYPDWAELSERGRRYVEVLVELTQPPRVDRLALRYINHFRLPHPGTMDEYFLGLPSYPEPLPQFISNLVSRVTLHDPDRDFTAHITLLGQDMLFHQTVHVVDEYLSYPGHELGLATTAKLAEVPKYFQHRLLDQV